MNTFFWVGNKFQANAKNIKLEAYDPHIRVCEKVANLLALAHLELRTSQRNYLIQINYEENWRSRKNHSGYSRWRRKGTTRNENLALQYHVKSVEYEEKENICGADRNSNSKTDHEVAALCLKDEYSSGLGSKMHPAYYIVSSD